MEGEGKKKGKQSFLFEHPVQVASGACIGGKMEAEGPLGVFLDEVDETNQFEGENWEDSESRLLKKAITLAVKKAQLRMGEIDCILCGDLLGQMIASSFGVKELELPMLGIYGACSTMGEGLLLGAVLVDGGFADSVVAATSSHFASAEKEFRFPLSYGNQRPPCTSWTVTGGGATVLKREEKRKDGIYVTRATPGKITDYGIKDKMNMGACMAPAAAATIATHLNDFSLLPDEYDAIITGDLGEIGSGILLDLLKEKGYDITRQHKDCGLLIYDNHIQDVHSGGSGCGCAAVTLNGYILEQMRSGEWKKVLFVPTGALLSTVSSNEGNSVPGIAHAVALERS